MAPWASLEQTSPPLSDCQAARRSAKPCSPTKTLWSRGSSTRPVSATPSGSASRRSPCDWSRRRGPGGGSLGGVDSFLAEYGLSSEEGVLLLCLAEALLRIPDAATADRLIAGTIGTGDWERHVGHSDSVLVNASTWGLMLTGHILDWGLGKVRDLGSLIQRLIARSGEPVIRQALRQAMRILGNQFVLGETIEEALSNAEGEARAGYRFSFDMLGEAARTAEDAARYTARYEEAVAAIAAWAGEPKSRADEVLHARPGVSVKLSALHPRYEPPQEARLDEELMPRLASLARAMRDAWLPLTIDAEEAERLDLSLAMLEPLFTDPALSGWNGLGLAVQAYSKRALPLIDWLAGVAEATGRRIPVRLVKGAYWDSEIKWAQEAGFASYPVFTRKVNTDVAYLTAARSLLARPDCFYPQFATHNAHTIAAIAELAGSQPYEFQRLYGMGQALHREVVHPEALGKPCRIYAPVGGHRDLLAYLVRRLLENGANTSFVNRLADDAAPIAAIVADPVEKAAALPEKANPLISPPPKLYAPVRKNSLGLPLWETSIRGPLVGAITAALERPATAGPIVSGRVVETGGEVIEITSPHDRRVVVGRCRTADRAAIDAALGAAKTASEVWDRSGGVARAEILERAADLFEADRPQLMALMVREAGKTLANAQADLREAVDFLRYYAAEARAKFEMPQFMVGPTGERNEMSLHGRGVFAAISPWNFPLAIFTGQIAGAFAAGNAVLAKPAEQTPLVAARAARLLHQAGVPGDVLHLLPGRGEVVGAALVADPRVDGVVFTGGTDTGRAINRALAARDGPIPKLIAETGGLNAMIVIPRRSRASRGRCAAVRLRQRRSALLGFTRPLPSGGRRRCDPRHAGRRCVGTHDRRSPRLRDRYRPGHRRRGQDDARSPQSQDAKRGSELLDLPLGPARRTAPMWRPPSTRSRRSACSSARCSGPSCTSSASLVNASAPCAKRSTQRAMD